MVLPTFSIEQKKTLRELSKSGVCFMKINKYFRSIYARTYILDIKKIVQKN